jgi:hypothetical protein
MTTLQKILITLAIAGLAGAGIYAARKAIQLRTQVQTRQQSLAPLLAQIQQLQKERDEVTSRLAAASLLRLANGKSEWRFDERKPLPCNDLKRRAPEINPSASGEMRKT